MASIFEVIEGLTVDQEDIVEAELFAEQYLSAQFPTYDFRQGTAIRDMTVRPNATLLALISKATKLYFDNTDIQNISNDTDKDIVDKRLSNFFITRKSGEKSVIAARLYFTFPTNNPMTTIIPVSAYFSVDNEIKFYPKGNITVYATETPGEYSFSYDASSDQWYVDIQLESATPSADADLESGDLLYFTVFSPYFLRATIQYLESKAIESETNEEMISRSYTSISTRNLINTPSIISRVGDQFNYAKAVYPVGLGSDWMFRDLIDIAGVEDPENTYTYHRGGHTDIYVETDPITQTAQLTAVEDEAYPGTAVFFAKGPIYELGRSAIPPAGSQEDTVPLYEIPNDPASGTFKFLYSSSNSSDYYSDSTPITPSDDIGLSADQVIRIVPGQAISAGDTATFTFKVFQGIGSLNDKIHTIEERVVCADYLTRSFEPIFIDINIVPRGAAYQDIGPARAALKEYIGSIGNGGSLYVSEIINIIIDNGVRDFTLPLDIKGVRYPRNPEGNETEGTTNIVVTDVADMIETNDIQKFYLRDVEINQGI